MKKYLASGNHLYPDSTDDEFQSWDRVYLASDVDALLASEHRKCSDGGKCGLNGYCQECPYERIAELEKVLRELTVELPETIPDGMPPLAYWMALATEQRHIARKALSLMVPGVGK